MEHKIAIIFRNRSARLVGQTNSWNEFIQNIIYVAYYKKIFIDKPAIPITVL